MKGITGKLCLSDISHLCFARLLIKKNAGVLVYVLTFLITQMELKKKLKNKKENSILSKRKKTTWNTLALPGMFVFSFLLKKKESFQIKIESMD